MKRSPDPDYTSNQQLRHMCDNVLQLLTNTVDNMENVRIFKDGFFNGK